MRSHLSLVEDIRTPDRTVLLGMNLRSTPAACRQELQAVLDSCSTAIQEVDKLNTHRLYELTGTTPHMLSSLSLVGELIREKRHQVLKRAAKRANNIAVPQHAMKTVDLMIGSHDFNSNVEAANAGSTVAQRACFAYCKGERLFGAAQEARYRDT